MESLFVQLKMHLPVSTFTFLWFFFIFRFYVIFRPFLNLLCYLLTPALIRLHVSFKFSNLLSSLSLYPHFLHSLTFILFSPFLRGGHAKL
jgi:hypothetical protein